MECKGSVVVWSNLVYVQHEAAKVQQGIAALLAEKAQLASQMELQAQLLASPELLQNHPELRWEQAAAAGNGSSLGSARELFCQRQEARRLQVGDGCCKSGCIRPDMQCLGLS